MLTYEKLKEAIKILQKNTLSEAELNELAKTNPTIGKEMQRKLVNLPDDVAERFDSVIAPGQRSKIMAELLMQEAKRREAYIERCVTTIEAKESLSLNIASWEKSTGDVIDDLW